MSPDAAQGGDAKFQAFLAQCRASYADVDARIEKAGVHDDEFFAVPGFPYIRTDRLMSSYRTEVSGDLNALGAWMLQLRENDSIARDIELTNLGMPKSERADLLNTLRTCAVWFSFDELADRATLAKLIEAARITDAPQPAPATHGTSAAGKHATPILWQATPASADVHLPRGFADAPRDELGRVGLLMDQWPALAAQHAPKLLIETSGEGDRIGAPILTAAGPSVDPARPVVYYLPGYARVGTRTLVQLNYFAWFSSGPGALDGLIWRVTLGEDGKPLVNESVRADGGDYVRVAAHGEVFVALRSRSHAIDRLATGNARRSKMRRYELRPYEDLMTLDAPSGGTRSLFGPDGTVPGSTMRQWGHHAISPTRYFDDPRLIEESHLLRSSESARAAFRVDWAIQRSFPWPRPTISSPSGSVN